LANAITAAAAAKLNTVRDEFMEISFGTNVPDWQPLLRRKEMNGYGKHYQRSTRGPSKAPMAVASRIPRLYQVSTKIADASPQCRQ
jgi:hypothetical protein